MPCNEWEDLLLGYRDLGEDERRSVDVHLGGCAECRTFLESFEAIDSRLTEMYAGMLAPPGLRETVLDRARREPALQKLSRLPEILDFAGWGALAAFALVVVAEFGDDWQLAPVILWATGSAGFVAVALWAGLRSWSELDR